MGRTVKRVKKDFNYPIGKVWYGYLNPYLGPKCPVCDGDGYTNKAKKYNEEWFGHDTNMVSNGKGGYWYPSAHQYNLEQYEVDALWEEGRLRGFKEVPSCDEINKMSREGSLYHDGINQYVCLKAYMNKHGYEISCPYCEGYGYIIDKEAFEKWKGFEPEIGDYYQLWETTSEGSPKTPPFATPEELAQYCVDNKISIFAHATLTYDEWLEFINLSLKEQF